jgi:hypothetical protein
MRLFLVVILVVSVAGKMSGQQVALTLTGNQLSVAPPGSQARAGDNLNLTCSGIDCKTLIVRLDETEITAQPTPSPGSASYPIPATATAVNTLRISSSANPAIPALILPIQSSGATDTGRARQPLDVLRRVCGTPRSDAAYDARNNIAQVVVSPLGNVLDRPVESIDEDDLVRVIIWGDPELLPRLRVRRTSPFRTPGGIRIVGQDADIDKFRKLSAGPEKPCEELTVELADFESGKGVVEISLIGADEEFTLGSFELGVAPLYTGAFSFGAVWTKLANPTFGLVFNGTDSIISQTDDAGSFRIKYAVFYTPFILGPRDIRKPGLSINPTLGIVLDDVSDNVLVGASVDILSSAYLTAGVHAGRVRRIDDESGLDVGEAFDGSSSQIPVQRRWRTQFFLGTSIDLRAAVQLFRVVFGAAGS